jgi:hypothetical protein
MTIGGEGIEQIGEGCPDGLTIGGSATEKVSLYGVAPVVQQTAVNALTGSTAAVSSSAWGFASSTVATIVIQDVHDMHNALVNLGILNQ